MKTCSILLFTALTAISAFGQEAKVSMSPPEVEAGKNITLTITVNVVPSLERTSLSVTMAPRDPKDNAQPFSFSLGQKGDSKVYVGITQVPSNGKGVWSIRDVSLSIPLGGSVPLETNRPEFTIKPIKITLPKTGNAEITVP
jgi:hypothetical protein